MVENFQCTQEQLEKLNIEKKNTFKLLAKNIISVVICSIAIIVSEYFKVYIFTMASMSAAFVSIINLIKSSKEYNRIKSEIKALENNEKLK